MAVDTFIAIGAVVIAAFTLLLRVLDKSPSIREHNDLKDRVKALEDTNYDRRHPS